VLLSGGEPTLHRHFLELLDFGLQLGLTITINTNGVTSFSMRPR
jgi:MoaA/NifB/PqqE/SkfB family radical SAM enzyme